MTDDGVAFWVRFTQLFSSVLAYRPAKLDKSKIEFLPLNGMRLNNTDGAGSKDTNSLTQLPVTKKVAVFLLKATGNQ